ncbi:ABC transporter ATP-binding protein [Mycoavidus sp. B2-EB]|uniref:ABC transporter ATP-binding protein n=1 Tax=Mycoavidus sp. B2-EB TaxID=2651972 RepID=UPI0016296AAF|nr:ABC transporter ATP-binding protein [Mycoavidus sp. B2-EB]
MAETAAPYAIKLIIDQISLKNLNKEEIKNIIEQTILIYAALILILECSIRICNGIWIKILPDIKADIQSKALEFIHNKSLDFIFNQLAGDLVNKYRNLTDCFEKMARIFLYGIYPTVSAFFFSLIFIAYINIYFSSIFLLWFLAMNISTWIFFRASIVASNQQSKIQSNLIGYVGNLIQNAMTLFTFSRTRLDDKKFYDLCRQNAEAARKYELITWRADSLRSLLSWVLLVSMMIFLGVGWQKSWISLGDFSFVTAICFYVRRSVWMTSLQFAEFCKEMGVMQDALAFVYGVQATHQMPNLVAMPPLTDFSKCIIHFDRLQFSFNQDQSFFKDLNLTISAGQKIGIAGQSGAGKTSLVHLLLRLHIPQKGTILLNGQDYRNWPTEKLMSLFSYVPQNVSLLHRSVFDNIAFGKENVSRDDVYQAAKICLCEEFIPFLENGYDTIVGEGGYKLSGGQRQRIALARAYLKQAPIFVLDEALSGLDPKLEQQLLEQLCQHLEHHTILMISHRPTALLKMDRVLTLHHGEIILDRSADGLTESKIWSAQG